jgi:hypothetical protein
MLSKILNIREHLLVRSEETRCARDQTGNVTGLDERRTESQGMLAPPEAAR